jgi:hypothetical protein
MGIIENRIYKEQNIMNENMHNLPLEETQDHIMPQCSHRPRWNQLHHTWSFWIFLILMFVAII